MSHRTNLICECGNRATRLHNSAVICDRCYEIERRQKTREHREGHAQYIETYTIAGEGRTKRHFP